MRCLRIPCCRYAPARKFLGIIPPPVRGGLTASDMAIRAAYSITESAHNARSGAAGYVV
jgi:hypothetical protein